MNTMNRRFGCPVELALEILGGKWKPIILARLKDGPLRYGALRARVPKLSDKMLTQRLTDLEAQGLVSRNKVGGRGSPSTWRLTARGQSLRPVLQGLYDWGERVADQVGAIIEPKAPAANTRAASSARGIV